MKKIQLAPHLKNILELVDRKTTVVVASGLAKYREKNGIKANFLANQLGISTSFLCAIEKGRRPVPSHLVQKIERALS